MFVNNRLTKAIVISMTAMSLLAVGPASALADSDTTSAKDVAVAIDQIKASTDLLIEPSATDIVTIPQDPAKGIRVRLPDGKDMAIGLPDSRKASKNAQDHRGVAVFAAEGSSANAVTASQKGVQFLTTIKNKKAPTSFTYPLDLPAGGRVSVEPGGGAAAIINKDGSLMSYIPKPWAKDARGGDVDTYFTTDGNALTQHVSHRKRGTKYPVVADPLMVWIPAWVLRTCGVGFLGGWAGAWVGGDDMWRRLGGGAVGCIFGVLGMKVAR